MRGRVRRVELPVAVAAASTMVVLHAAWALGARWGYSDCGFGELTQVEARTGCHAAEVADVGLVDGWLSATGWLVTTLVLVVASRHPDRTRPAAWIVAVGLLVVSFPLHLLFEIPVGVAGEPTDWRHVATRVVATAVAITLLRAVRTPPCQHPRAAARALPRWGSRAAWVAGLTPAVGWVLPHLAWMIGLRVGISDEVLDDAQTLPVAAQLAVTFAPLVGAVPSIGLAQPWTQRLPRRLVVGAGGAVAVLLTAYGLIGCSMMVHDLITGDTDPGELADSWAVVLTELLFVVWGIALAAAVAAFHQATRCRACLRAPIRVEAVA